MNYKIFSYYNDNIPSEVIISQKRVFDLFQIPIIQIKYSNDDGDWKILDQIISDNSNVDYLIFFDIDCIPLTDKFLEVILADIKNDDTLSGMAQACNHKGNPDHLYVGKAFMGLSLKLFRMVGSPSMQENFSCDTSEYLTFKVRDEGYKVKYWMPTSVKIPKWRLSTYGNFGLGTIYEDMIYHEFNIAKSPYYNNEFSVNDFIKCCNEMVNL
jgi:hypothetical protein